MSRRLPTFDAHTINVNTMDAVTLLQKLDCSLQYWRPDSRSPVSIPLVAEAAAAEK